LGQLEIKDLALRTKHGIAEDAGIVATESNAKSLVLVHPLPIYREKVEDLIKEAKKHFEGPIKVPIELETIDI